MRIAVVTTSWPRFPGDPSGHFVEADTRVLTQCSDERDPLEVVVIHAEGHAFGFPGFAARVKEAPARLVDAARWVARARAQVTAGKFDEVVAHWAVPSAWPIAIGGKHELHVVSHGGDVRLLLRFPRRVRAALARRIASRARTWRFVSEALLASLLEAIPDETARAVRSVAVIAPSAIDVTRPSDAAIAARRAQVGEPFAVCVARLVPSKRVDAAIAWASSQRRSLVIVGDGPLRDALENAARVRGAPVRFVGRTTRAEALEWIASSSELIQPSRTEGASTVVREATALGVPVVEI
jgi:teichuronic acid biosynthesis glycosyltransferase TuaC